MVTAGWIISIVSFAFGLIAGLCMTSKEVSIAAGARRLILRRRLAVLLPASVLIFWAAFAYYYWSMSPFHAGLDKMATFAREPSLYTRVVIGDYIGGGLAAFGVGATATLLYKERHNKVPVWVVLLWTLIPPLYFAGQAIFFIEPAANTIFDPLNQTKYGYATDLQDGGDKDAYTASVTPRPTELAELRTKFLDDNKDDEERFFKIWVAISGLLGGAFLSTEARKRAKREQSKVVGPT